MARLQFGRSVCENLDEPIQHEWLETNGLGGFASSTLSGAHTRRYHGLLVAPVEGLAAARYLLLSKVQETLIVGGQRFELSTNLYPGVVHPEGYRYLTAFRLDPYPIFTFEAGGVTLEKRTFLAPGENTVVIEYETGAADCRIELRPLIAFRGFHDLTHSNPALNRALEQSEGLVAIQPYPELPRFWFGHNGSVTSTEGAWYFNFEYPRERDRGLDFQEDLFCPFVIAADLTAGHTLVVIASTASHPARDSPKLKAARHAAPFKDDVLRSAAAQFMVRQENHKTVIAGYPWFGVWGRDTMIALPGLTLATGHFDAARKILLAFAGYLDKGMLPNRFPDSAHDPEYNTVDATLWFFEAIRKYLEYTEDASFVRKHLYEKLKDVVGWHVRGTRFGIHADADALLTAGDATTQLTWMDARTGDAPVTPRSGKAVEIQALWYNALRVVAKLARDYGENDTAGLHDNLATKVAKNLNSSFWNEQAGCLFDVVDGEKKDSSLRPNQAIALSLGYCAFPAIRARKILAMIEKQLLTPYGLRTLAPSDPRFRGRYEGSVAERDAAYHQGTVWPWLLGPFITADIRFNGEAARSRAAGLLDHIQAFMLSRGTGQLPEIFDGDAPHQPRGCIAQAWSVAEVLRIKAEAGL